MMSTWENKAAIIPANPSGILSDFLSLFLIKGVIKAKTVLSDALEVELDGMKSILVAVHTWVGDFSYTSPFICKKV